MQNINNWWAANKAEGKTSVLFGYSLGKAQQLLKYLDTNIGSIHTHGAIENKGFVLSDHCDWDGLLRSIKATGAQKIEVYPWIHFDFCSLLTRTRPLRPY